MESHTLCAEMSTQHTCPLPRSKVIEQYFLEHRAKLLDLAAFLDRIDRAAPDANAPHEDFRITAMRRAVSILLDEKPGRAKRIQELFSDHSSTPIDKAPGKGATGAVPL